MEGDAFPLIRMFYAKGVASAHARMRAASWDSLGIHVDAGCMMHHMCCSSIFVSFRVS